MVTGLVAGTTASLATGWFLLPAAAVSIIGLESMYATLGMLAVSSGSMYSSTKGSMKMVKMIEDRVTDLNSNRFHHIANYLDVAETNGEAAGELLKKITRKIKRKSGRQVVDQELLSKRIAEILVEANANDEFCPQSSNGVTRALLSPRSVDDFIMTKLGY